MRKRTTMEKRRSKTPPTAHRQREAITSDMQSALAPCGCGTIEHAGTVRDGVGPGRHAAGVDHALKVANLKHLKRLEGQVRGIATMIEQDRYCADIIQQCAAVQESLRSVARNLLRNHLTHCVQHAMQGDKAQQAAMLDELVELVGRIAR